MKRLAIALLLTLAATLPFAPALRADFLNYDDSRYITKNRMVLAGLSEPGVRWAFSTFHNGNWHPITWLSLMLDQQLFGGNPLAYHAENLLYHAINTLLLWSMIKRLFGRPNLAAIVALLWAVHPLRVESVVWISERKDVLAMLFGLLAIHAYLGTRNSELGTEAGTSSVPGSALRVPRSRPALTALLMTLSLMCKPLFVTLPLLLILLEIWPLRRWSSAFRVPHSAILTKWPLWLLSAVFGCIASIAQTEGDAMMGLDRVSIWGRVSNALVSVMRYLGMMLWPADLCPLYPHPGSWAMGAWGPALLGVGAITLLVWRWRRSHPSLAFGWAWFVISLMPMIGLVQVGLQALADRYTYLPMAGLLIGIVYALPSRAMIERGAAASALAIACVWGAVSWQQSLIWRDSITLMTHSARVTDRHPFLLSSLASAYQHSGRMVEAAKIYEQCMPVLSNYSAPLNDYGVVLLALNRPAEALPLLWRAAQLKPNSGQMLNNLGSALRNLNRPAEALPNFTRAAELDPFEPDIHFNHAGALIVLGRQAEAVAPLQRAIDLNPKDVEARLNLATVFSLLGRQAEALAAIERASRVRPFTARELLSIAAIHSKGGDAAKALASCRSALALNPRDPQILLLAGRSLAVLGRVDEAIEAVNGARAFPGAETEAQQLLQTLLKMKNPPN